MTTADKIHALLAELGDEEQLVILDVTRRLALGQAQYGKLDVATDSRNWTKEASEELQDLVVYLAIKLLAKERAR